MANAYYFKLFMGGQLKSFFQTYSLASHSFGSDLFMSRCLCIYVHTSVPNCQRFLEWESNIKP